MKRFVPVIVERLQATRLQLLDVYGHVAVAEPWPPDPMLPAPYRRRRQAPGAGRHLDARARAGRRDGVGAFAPGQFAMLYAFGVGEAPISVSGDGERAGALVHTVRAVGAVTERDLRARARRRSWACAARSAPAGRWPRPRAATSWSSPAASAWRRCARRSSDLLANRDRYGRSSLLYGGALARELLYPSELERWRGPGIDVDVTVDTAPARTGAGASGWSRR